MARLAGKIAIVTGGAGGIGSTTARLFAKEGAAVMLVDRDEAALARAAKTMPAAQVATCVADVSDDGQTRRYVEETERRFGGVDVLFANAGTEGTLAPIADANVEDFDRVWRVNVRGVWLALHHGMPRIAARGGGSVIVTSSVAGLVGFEAMGAYVASKHAVVGLMRTAALEGARARVRVNTIHPGPVDNAMMGSLERQAAPGAPEQARKGFEGLVPLGRYATNEEIASVALFLASDESAYVTGHALAADGGLTAR
jgi:NAD(P)-dependent dehydrogenase (short-subunit alcohol dehydrogenase family)